MVKQNKYDLPFVGLSVVLYTVQSPRSQLRKTGKGTQTSMFRTNKKNSYLYEILAELIQKNLFYLLKITFTYFD